MCANHGKIDLGFTSEKFPKGTHMCYIYNDDEERKSIMSKFIEAGLNGNEKVAYFAHSMDKSEMLNVLEEEGVSLSDENKDKFIVANAGQTYCPDGTFDPKKMAGNLINFYQGTMAEGYSGARVSGEMLWLLDGKPGNKK